MIAIVDYGLGNLRSVAGAIERVGFKPLVTSDPDELAKADKLILPGVGAFGDGMKNLRERNLDTLLTELVVEQSKPILGICLGFQLMGQKSCEFGCHDGLGWIDATITRLEVGLRLPHVGWNDLKQVKPSPLFDGISNDALFYYVHSYHMAVDSEDAIIGKCEYGIEFTAAVEQGNIFGTQFHPEKSQSWGLALLQNYLSKA